MTHPLDPYNLVNTFIDKKSIQLVSVLGIGAYGIVYLGVHVPSSRRYAIKLITRHTSNDSEIQLHCRVSGHSGILKLEKVVHEERDNRTYLVLEYAPGGDLFTAITRQQGIMGNEEAIRYIFLQLVDAVQYCHEQGVAHRDLKPENILVFPQWRVKLADFGLATTQLVSAGFGCGSTFYFSPECQGHTINKGYSTRQNDVWSLGVILVNMATGRNPWRQASFIDPTFQRYMKRPKPSFFMATLPRISEEFAVLLSRIFCLDPSRRISLPELRIRIKDLLFFKDSRATFPFGGKSNQVSQSQSLSFAVYANSKPRHKKSVPSIPSGFKSLPLSRSLVHSLCDYVDGWSDHDDYGIATKAYNDGHPRPLTEASLLQSPPPSSSSACSSNSSGEYNPPTPQASPMDPYKIDMVAASQNISTYHQHVFP